MNSPQFSAPDTARSRLRATVATIEREISRPPSQVTDDGSRSPPNGLAASWADLVEQLALGPEPEMRQCPVCKHFGMRAATLCGYCWTKLTPPTGRDGDVCHHPTLLEHIDQKMTAISVRTLKP
jgi:hypothetical protein